MRVPMVLADAFNRSLEGCHDNFTEIFRTRDGRNFLCCKYRRNRRIADWPQFDNRVIDLEWHDTSAHDVERVGFPRYVIAPSFLTLERHAGSVHAFSGQ